LPAVLPALAALLLPLLAHSGEDDDESVPDQIVFQLNDPGQLQSVLDNYGLSLIDTVAGVATYLAAGPPGTNEEILVQQMLADPQLRVVAAEEAHLAEAPEGRFRTLAIADGDHTFTDVQGQEALQLVGAGASGWTGRNVIVAVLDTGVGPHPDLASVLISGHDFIEDDDQPDDVGDGQDNDEDGQTDEGVGHGTHVAGIIHAIAPEAKILPVRVLDSEGQGSVFAIAQGIRYAVDYSPRVRVLNLSLSLVAHESPSIEEALYYAFSRQVVVVTSAGNGNPGTEREEYPSRESNTISVASTDLQDVKAAFSNYNDKVDITAPGVSILSLYTGAPEQFATWSGTSMSAPFVAGAAALVRQARPELGREAVEDLILNNAKDISAQNPGLNGLLGDGRLDIAAVLNRLPPPPPPVPSLFRLPAALLGLALCLLRAAAASRRRRPKAASPPARAAARARTS
jgi:subtilisin family serine protease